MLEQYLPVIQEAALFEAIAPGDLLNMLDCINPKVKDYSKDENITLAGQKAEGIGLILGGEATLSKETVSGDRVILHKIKPGDMFGEMLAFSNQENWPATVQADSAAKVMFLPSEKIVGHCGNTCSWHQQLVVNLLRLVSNRALILNRKVEYLTIKGMRARLCTYLLEQMKQSKSKTFSLNMNRNELADFLNVSRPSMSRELGRMRDEGLIDFHLSAIRIMDENALKQFLIE